MSSDYETLLAMFRREDLRAWGQREPGGGRRLHLDFAAAGACVTFQCNRRGRLTNVVLEARVHETVYKEERRR